MVYITRNDLLAEMSDRIRVMRSQESAQYAVPDYLSADWQQKLRVKLSEQEKDDDDSASMSSSPSQSADDDSSSSSSSSSTASSSSSKISEDWREKICDWCYRVVDHFDVNREVVSITMSYLDRYLATRTASRRIFQLAAMTALFLAIKLFEPKKLRLSDLASLARGYYTNEHIVIMESSILRALGWHVHPPTSFAFIRDFMRLVSGEVSYSARRDVNELARFLAELSVCDYWFATRRPSSIALAALINAIELQGHYKIDPKYKDDFLRQVVVIGVDLGKDGDEIIECYKRLQGMYIAGGYTPNLEKAPVAGGELYSSNIAETHVLESYDLAKKTCAQPSAHAASPNAVISETTPTSRKRRALTSGQVADVKRTRVNLNKDFYEEHQAGRSQMA